MTTYSTKAAYVAGPLDSDILLPHLKVSHFVDDSSKVVGARRAIRSTHHMDNQMITPIKSASGVR